MSRGGRIACGTLRGNNRSSGMAGQTLRKLCSEKVTCFEHRSVPANGATLGTGSCFGMALGV